MVPLLLAEDEHAVDFWERHVRLGVLLTQLAAAIGWAYCLLSLDRPHRPLILGLLGFAALGSAALLPFTLARLARSPRVLLVLYAWSATTCVVITLIGLLDDATAFYGLLYAAVLVYAATAYPPAAVRAVGLLALVGYAATLARHRIDLPVTVASTGTLAVVGVLCAAAAGNRWLVDARHRSDEARFRSLFRHASDLVTVVDGDRRVRFQSSSLERFLGLPADAVEGQRFDELVHPDDLEAFEEAWAGVCGSGGSSARVQLRLRHADASWRRVETVAADLLDDPDVAAVVLTSRDTEERARLEGELRHQAATDELTGLANRSSFVERVRAALADHRPGSPAPAVVFFDLDDFKTVNDSLGHEAGDAVLVTAAQRLRACLRPADVASRLGGDELALLLEGVGRADRAVAVAERVQAELGIPLELHGRLLGLRASAGVVLATEGATAEELVRDADTAMYVAKRAGKGRVTVFEPWMHASNLERLDLKADLGAALAADQFVLHYQPVVELATGAITGAEALVRWAHPTRGLVPPDAFIPLAEESGLVLELGRRVLGQACAQLARWDAELGVPLALGVNVSVRQLEEPAFVGDVERVLATTGLDPSRLTLEVTESLLVERSDRIVAGLSTLKGLGVQVAIDDFGTGYSSLSQLEHLPVDILKVDRAFLATVDQPGGGLVPAILDLAAAIGLRTVAEGVERAEQHLALEGLPCTWAQGWYYGRPLEAAAFAALVRHPASRARVGAPTR